MYVWLPLCDCVYGKGQLQLGHGKRSLIEVRLLWPHGHTWLVTRRWLSCSRLCSTGTKVWLRNHEMTSQDQCSFCWFLGNHCPDGKKTFSLLSCLDLMTLTWWGKVLAESKQRWNKKPCLFVFYFVIFSHICHVTCMLIRASIWPADRLSKPSVQEYQRKSAMTQDICPERKASSLFTRISN